MKFRKLLKSGVGALALVSAGAAAQDPDSTAQGDVSVTIYNGDLAVVQDVRSLDIASGRSTIAFPDVSARIRPETLSFVADGAGIVEQNFDFDLLTPTKLMEKAIGQTVTLVRTNPATGAETRERAEVLSTAGGVVVRIGDRIEVLRDDGLPTRVVFDEVPPNLRARPTLSVTVESARAGRRPAAIRYLTPGLGWSADYVALFDDQRGTIDMQGWVTLTNTTGTTFHSADTLLVAGNPNNRGSRRSGNPGMVRPGTQTAERERLGDFYLYPLAERTTIANAQTKQVGFLDATAIPANKQYARLVGWLDTDRQPQPVDSRIQFNTSREGGLGDALPAGTIRFYQRDSQGNPQFIGENDIGHTPMGSLLQLDTGTAFDVYVQAEVEDREKIDSGEWRRAAQYKVFRDGEEFERVDVERPIEYWQTTMRYTLTNARSEPVTVQLVQDGLGGGNFWRDWRLVSEDVPGEQANAERRVWQVTVPANGERVVRATFQTRY